jgi:hypothetical protein
MGHVGAIGMVKLVRSAKAFVRITQYGHTAPQFSRS